jgi:hypothetical protein
MKKVKIVVLLVTLFVVVYHASPFVGVPQSVTVFMFILSPSLTIYMAYTILKYGKPSGKTFDETFYEDADLKS